MEYPESSDYQFIGNLVWRQQERQKKQRKGMGRKEREREVDNNYIVTMSRAKKELLTFV